MDIKKNRQKESICGQSESRRINILLLCPLYLRVTSTHAAICKKCVSFPFGDPMPGILSRDASGKGPFA
jgi:hypothetical protein